MEPEFLRLPEHLRECVKDRGPRYIRYEHETCLYVQGDLAFLTTHKCGRTAVAEALGPGITWPKYLALDTPPPIVTMWRDPHERMESTYRWARRASPHRWFVGRGDKLNYMFPPPDKPFSSWVASVCKYPVDSWFDSHLKSQTWFNADHPALCLRWDWDVFDHLFGVKIERTNVSDPGVETEWTDAARQAFEQCYAEDIKFWNGGKYHTPTVGGDFAILPPLDCGTCGACCQGGKCYFRDRVKQNCSIYEWRPQPCRDFDCRRSVNDVTLSPAVRVAGLLRLYGLS
jgi:hypothetical protein